MVMSTETWIIVLLVLLVSAILISVFLYKKYDKLKVLHNILLYDYKILQQENNWLKNNLEKSTREKKFVCKGNKPVEQEAVNADSDAQSPKNISKEETQANVVAQIEKVSEKVLPKEVTMYASFPRSAGNCIYFSDLTESLGDDSYFELKISKDKSTATFRPLDFMKIRNYDSAMIALRTEGVKPNVASTVLGIENGKAHKEGADWIVDNLAKIKLA